MNEKRCPRCDTTKPLSEFYSAVNRPDGRATYCAPCSREYTRERAKLPKVQRTRRKWAKGKGRSVQDRYRFKPENRNKKAAQLAVMQAIRSGELERVTECSSCGSDERVEAHHDDYSRPLDVRWLCRVCHRGWHRKHGPGRNADTPVQA